MWRIECDDTKNAGQTINFIRAMKSNSPTPKTEHSTIPPNGDSFMFKETSSKNFGPKVKFL